MMKGLELSEHYYREQCAPALADLFPALSRRIAAGLVGEGSECFGFDDELSQDHDWGVSLCLWLNKRDYKKYRNALEETLNRLPTSYRGYPRRILDPRAGKREGVWEIGEFYFKQIGLDAPPGNSLEWMAIPEINLAAATNGKVFADPVGEFSKFRERLLAFYPEEVRRKKVAAQCASAAQSGQYNFPRCIKRKEYVAAAMAESMFIRAVCSTVFLLNKRYKPYYKWLHRALGELPLLGAEVAGRLSAFVERGREGNQAAKQMEIIEDICALIASELVKQELSTAKSDFLLDHGASVQAAIQDDMLKNMNIFLG